MRFPGFEGDWEKKKLGQVATNKSEKYNPANATGSIKCIELEHLASESGQMLGYIDGSRSGSIKNVFHQGDILFGKLRPYLRKYLQAPFEGVCSSEIWVLKGINVSNNFLYRIIQTNKFVDLANQSSGSKMPRADWNIVERGVFSFPSTEEQNKIASFLTLIDQRIQTQNKIIEELKLLKSVIRYKLFQNIHRFNPDTNHIKDVLEYEQPGKYIVESDSYYLDSSLTPVLTANKMFILGYTNEKNGIYGKGDCIIFDDFTMDMKFVDFPFKVKSSAIKILTSKSVTNLRYVFEYLSSLNLTPVGHKRHYISEIEVLLVLVPKQEIQNEIANLFCQIDDKINNEINFKRQLCKQKTYLMDNLFI